MPRYYLDVIDGDEVLDPEGEDFANGAEALDGARKAAVDLWAEAIRDLRDPTELAVRVRTTAGTTVGVVDYRSVFTRRVRDVRRDPGDGP